MTILRSIRALWTRVVSAILDAQQVIGPVEESDTLAPALASPDLVGALVHRDVYDEQTALSHTPVRSTKADAKRAAHAYAERRAGHALTWKQARKLLSQWERLERANERRVAEIHAKTEEMHTFQQIARSVMR